MRIFPAALEELQQAAAYYREERPELAVDFLDAVDQAVQQAESFPASGTRVDSLSAKHEVRRFLVARFPYRIYVARVGGDGEVMAIAHHARRPGYWRQRLTLAASASR